MSSTKSCAPERFRRHCFVWLDPDIPQTLPPVRLGSEVLERWIPDGRPLVVRRPCLGPNGDTVHLGIALPPSLGKQRIAVEVPRSSVQRLLEPPSWEDCGAHVSPSAHRAVRELEAAAAAAGVTLRTFGSHAWQFLTKLPYVHPDSDLDLILPVDTAAVWDGLRPRLEALSWPSAPRMDLEVIVKGDASFQWREFITQSPRLLFKGNSSVWLGEREDVDRRLRT